MISRMPAFSCSPSCGCAHRDRRRRLAGPVFEVKFARSSTLPASQVPNLAAATGSAESGPATSQSAHYLTVVAFCAVPPITAGKRVFCMQDLDGKCATDGLTVTVPEGRGGVGVPGAAAGGDFKTLVSAVRGRPGAFVRTSQDLNQAALDRSRWRNIYRRSSLNGSDPVKLAESHPACPQLGYQVDDKGWTPAQLQAPCLMQGQKRSSSRGHSTSIVEALTSGPGSDLAMEAILQPQLSYGYYSPTSRRCSISALFESFGTAQYQYIPRWLRNAGQIALTLNTPFVSQFPCRSW